MNLIFLFGMPGVRKLTVAQELAKLTNFKVFHNHLTVDLVTSLFEFGSNPFIELREKIWLETFSQSLQAKLDGLIFTFAFDQTVPSDFAEKVKNLVEKNGGTVSFVELKCSTEELKKRIANSSRQSFGKLNSVEFFRELDSQNAFVRLNVSSDHVIESTSLSADETAQLIVKKLNLT